MDGMSVQKMKRYMKRVNARIVHLEKLQIKRFKKMAVYFLNGNLR